LPLPEKIPVKISSEAAGYVSFSPVLARQMTPAELLEQILGVTGKDAGRVREILEQGTVVSGASRFRWAPIQAPVQEVEEALRVFPDPRPERRFDPARCVRAVLAGGRGPIELTCEAASSKRWFGRRSFWQVLMETAEKLEPAYQQYSYADRADVYRVELPVEVARALREQANLLRFSSLEAMVREYSYDKLELWVER
jgi:hypothetical protein